MLRRLQLGPMAAILPESIALARRDQLDYAFFLESILSDEVNRRADRRADRHADRHLELRVRNADFEETCRLEDFDWSAALSVYHAQEKTRHGLGTATGAPWPHTQGTVRQEPDAPQAAEETGTCTVRLSKGTG